MDTDLLTELIARKHDVLVRLRDLSRRQAALVGQGDMTSLLAILATKQTLIGELTQTDRLLDPFRDQDPESRRWRSLDARLRCQQTAQACTALLSEIVLLEEHGEADLLRRRDDAAQKLQGAHSAGQARQGYGRSTLLTRGQLDLSSEG